MLMKRILNASEMKQIRGGAAWYRCVCSEPGSVVIVNKTPITRIIKAETITNATLHAERDECLTYQVISCTYDKPA